MNWIFQMHFELSKIMSSQNTYVNDIYALVNAKVTLVDFDMLMTFYIKEFFIKHWPTLTFKFDDNSIYLADALNEQLPMSESQSITIDDDQMIQLAKYLYRSHQCPCSDDFG